MEDTKKAFFGHEVETRESLEMAEAVLAVMRKQGFPRESIQDVRRTIATLSKQRLRKSA